MEAFTKFIASTILFVIDAWLIMLAVGALHSYYPQLPAIGLVPAGIVTFIIKTGAAQNMIDTD